MNKICLFATMFALEFLVIDSYAVNAQTSNEPIPKAVVDAEAVKMEKTVITDNFDSFTLAKPPQSSIPYLKKNGLDPEIVSQNNVPQKWYIEFNTLPLDYQFGERDKKFFVTTSQTFTMYGPYVMPTSRYYSMQLTVNMPIESGMSESSVGIGIYQYGLYRAGAEPLETIKLKNGERTTITVPIRLVDDLPVFRPMVKITGDINLENLTVNECNDDLYRDGMTILEGTLLECSSIPDPKDSDYPNCKFTCHLEGNTILKGKECPNELSLVMDAFYNYKILGTKTLKAGDKIRCLIIPFDELSDEQKTMQQSDDLNLFSLETYYVVGCYKINTFLDDLKAYPASGIQFSDANDTYVSLFARNINPPISNEQRQLQGDAISSELTKLNDLLDKYADTTKEELNCSFKQAWKEEQAKDKDGVNRIANYVWRNIEDSFWCLPSSYQLISDYPLISADNMASLLALRDFLNANGVQLIVLPIPNMHDISARVINKKFRNVPDFQTAYIVKQLLENGIEAIYSSDELLNSFNRFPWAYFYPNNGHPSDTTQDVLSDILSWKLSRFKFKETLDHSLFSVVMAPHVYQNAENYHFPSKCDIGQNIPGTAYQCRCVLYDGKTIPSDPTSPVLLLGNSYIQTPMPFPDSLPTLLVSKLNFGVTSYRIGGYGPMTAIIQQFFSNPQKMLTNKKVAILTMGIPHFTTSGNFNNIRKMDEEVLLLRGRKLVADFQLESNTADAPAHYAKLPDPIFFKIGDKGVGSVIDISLPQWDTDHEAVVVIQTSLDARSVIKFQINDTLVEIPKCYGQFRYLNVIHKLQSGTRSLTINAKGPSGEILAIRNIQIFQ